MVTKREQEVVVRFFELVDVNKSHGKKHPEYGVQTQVADEFEFSKGYVNECLRKYRRSDDNPTHLMVENAEKLNNAMVQLQKRSEMMDRSEIRYEKFDEKLAQTEEYENECRGSLRELDMATEILLEHLNTLNPDDYEEFKNNISLLRQDANIIKRLLQSKHSPLGYSTIISEERALLAEMRKEDQTKNMYLDSINSAQRVIIAINNMYYGGDPDSWDEKTLEKAIAYLNDKICPRCPGFERFLASLPQKDIFGDSEVIDVDSEDVGDE